MNTDFSNIKACVFDAYGTLFDVHSAVSRHSTSFGNIADRLSQTWRSKQLEYTWLHSLMRKHVDFWDLTGNALDYAMDAFDIGDTELRAKLMDAYLSLDPYPEVKQTLETLKSKGMTLAILSNGTPKMLEAAAKRSGIDQLLDALISVEEVSVYKPDPKVYALVETKLGVPPEQVAFQSSNSFDAYGAASFGYKVAWVNRFKQRSEHLPTAPHTQIQSLSELPELLGLES